MAAAQHGVASYVHDLVTDIPSVPTTERTALHTLRDHARLLHLRSLGDVAHLRDVFERAGVPWLIVKGPTLGTTVHGGPDRRLYSDLDVLVAPRAFGDAIDCLERDGAQVTDHNWTLIQREMKGEVHLRLPSGTALDLHWHLLNDRQRRAAFPVPIHELVAYPRLLVVDRVMMPTLGAAETLVYVALHTMLSGAHRLIWLKDLERLVATGTSDSDDVVDVATRWNAQLVLACALQRMRSAVPGALFDRSLEEPVRQAVIWHGLTRASWKLSPAARQEGGPSVGRIVARSIRASESDSLRELFRRSGRLIRQGDFRRRQTFANDDPRSGRYPSGGIHARRSFIREVARHAE